MAGWHYWLDGHEFEWTPEVGEGREAWRTVFHRVTKSWTWLSDRTELNRILDSFVDYDGYSISSKGLLPTLVDTMVIWVKFTLPVHFSSLIPRMPTFTLAISCLTTSNLPRFMYLTFQVPLQYCSYSVRPCFHHGSHPQLDFIFALSLSLHSFWSYFSTDLQYHIGHLLTRGVHLSVSYLLPFHTVYGVFKARNWSGLPFPSPVGHIFSDLSTMIHPSLVALHGMAHSFFELDKVVEWQAAERRYPTS